MRSNKPSIGRAPRIILENIIYLAMLILLAGIVALILEQVFIAEILITGGFMGVIVYFIVNRHENLVLRRMLGIAEDETLLDKIILAALPLEKYSYVNRISELEFGESSDPDLWSLKLKRDIIIMSVETGVDHINTGRWTDVELKAQKQVAQIQDLTLEAPPAAIELDVDARLSTDVKNFLVLRYTFLPDHDYKIELPEFDYGNCMKVDSDYLEMQAPVYTRSIKVNVAFPPTAKLETMGFDCYVVDSKFERRRSYQAIPDAESRTLAVPEQGPIRPGERLVIRYLHQES